MLKNSDMDHLKGFFLVCFAGTLWSFGALIIRYMIEARNYQWQYLFYRGLTIAIVLLFYIMAKEGKTFITSFRHSGASGLLGACGLVAAFIGFIWSITLTTVANSLFMLATTPFVAAFLGIVFLKEEVRQLTWAAMVIALAGILTMVLEGLEKGNIFGNVIALISATGFAFFSVSLRWRKKTPQFSTIALAGLICVVFTMLILFSQNSTIAMPLRNVYLSMLHGFMVGIGLILFATGAKFLPAAELTLLSMVEVIGGVLWVYLPIFGIHEVPSMLTMVGGVIVLFAIILDGVGTGRVRQMIRVS
ncbi:MAG: DMT family transporter [Deltaproteobacteria bacterium]|jgi:RarD protein|nr:DMT family transporter [Deltaproteobacteria bacterium]